MSRLCRESGVIQCILAGRDPRNNARASSMTALTSPYNFPSNGRRCRWGCVAPQPSRSRTSHQIRFRKSDLALVTKAGEGESPGIVYQDFQSATR